jgi:hypothetical protein
MSSEHHMPEQIVNKLREAEAELAKGVTRRSSFKQARRPVLVCRIPL